VVFLGALASEGLGPLVEARENTMPAETFLFVVEDEAGAVVGPAQWGVSLWILEGFGGVVCSRCAMVRYEQGLWL
jgi:hypothetical protein